MANPRPGTEGEITGLQLEGKELAAAIMRSAETGDHATKKILIRQWLRQTNAKVRSSCDQARGISSNSQLSAAVSEGGIRDKETKNVSSLGFGDPEKDNGSS